MEQVVWDTGDMLLENTCSHPDPDPNPHDARTPLFTAFTLLIPANIFVTATKNFLLKGFNRIMCGT